MSDAPQADRTPQEQPRQSRPKSYNTNDNARPRKASPPPFRGSWSPPPENSTQATVEFVKDLADQAKRNAERFKRLADSYRNATSSRPRTRLSEGIEIKLRHVLVYLENCEMKLRLRFYAAKHYNADVQGKKSPAPLPAFFPTLVQTHLNTNGEDVSDLQANMQRVLKDIQETLRMKRVLEANGKKQTDDEESVRTLQSSTEALDRLLAKLLTNTMGNGFPAEY